MNPYRRAAAFELSAASGLLDLRTAALELGPGERGDVVFRVSGVGEGKEES